MTLLTGRISIFIKAREKHRTFIARWALFLQKADSVVGKKRGKKHRNFFPTFISIKMTLLTGKISILSFKKATIIPGQFIQPFRSRTQSWNTCYFSITKVHTIQYKIFRYLSQQLNYAVKYIFKHILSSATQLSLDRCCRCIQI